MAVSTLAVAVAFGPLRRRVQACVDRRANRTRYGAQRATEAFAQRLRDEVDLDRLGTNLVTVTSDALPPSTVGLWPRPDPPR